MSIVTGGFKKKRVPITQHPGYRPIFRVGPRAQTYGPPRGYMAPMARTRRGRRSIAARTSPFRGPAGDAKYITIANSDYNFDTTGSIAHLSAVQQGSTVHERDGKAFRITSVQLRGYASNNSASVMNDCAALLVWDKQPNKALAAITDILDSANARSMNNRDNAGRFVVLRRWDFALTGKNDGSTVSGFFESFDYFVKCPRDVS